MDILVIAISAKGFRHMIRLDACLRW
jgi:hypothetical protein